MKMTEFLQRQLDLEVRRSRRALELVPPGKHAWKPHERSMQFGYLAELVATIPTWIAMIVQQDELDVAPVDGPRYTPRVLETSADYLKALDEAAAAGRAALAGTNDDHLRTGWKLLSGGKVVGDGPRDETIQDTFGHWAHHRGQLTVYLRLMGATVPALYGPSADEKRFDL